MNPLIQSKKTTILPALVAVTLTCFALSPQARAVCQEGCDSSLFNAFLGNDALINNTTGAGNTAFGWRSLFANTDGSFSTGVGAGALVLNNGSSNTAVGAAALLLNSFGTQNTAIGTDALVFNESGNDNTATGAFALFNNTAAYGNTAMGVGALTQNDISGNELAIYNTAVGFEALNANVDGSDNTAVGEEALFSNNNAQANTAVGDRTLMATTDGSFNTAIGASAMPYNVLGNSNTVVGAVAGFNLVNGDFNTYLGGLVGAQAPDEDSVIRIADLSSGYAMNACFIGGIFGNLTPGVPVYINADGQLSTTASSARFKDEIKPMEKASEAIFALKPVTFRYKKEFDRQGLPQFGLVAEEVEKVNPDLVYHDGQGEIYTVRYEAVNAMLLNEFLKEHRKVEEQGAMIAQQQKQIEALTVGLQKVSAQLEASKPAPQVVNNP
jgi:trimeric autotransporter adhesin